MLFTAHELTEDTYRYGMPRHTWTMQYEAVNKEVKSCALLVRNNKSVEATALKLVIERWYAGLFSRGAERVVHDEWVSSRSGSIELDHCVLRSGSTYSLNGAFFRVCSVSSRFDGVVELGVRRLVSVGGKRDIFELSPEMVTVVVDDTFSCVCESAVCIPRSKGIQYLFP